MRYIVNVLDNGAVQSYVGTGHNVAEAIKSAGISDSADIIAVVRECVTQKDLTNSELLHNVAQAHTYLLSL